MKQKLSRLIKPSVCLLHLDGSIISYVISLSFNTMNSVLKDINAPQTHLYTNTISSHDFFQVSFSFLRYNIISFNNETNISLLENCKHIIFLSILFACCYLNRNTLYQTKTLSTVWESSKYQGSRIYMWKFN